MKQLAFCLLSSALLVPNLANAGFYSGAQIIELGQAYDRIDAGRGSSADFQSSSLLIGYVSAIADANFGVYACASSSVTTGQVVAVALKYIRARPEQWNLPGNLLVGAALSDAFPCRR